MAMLSIYDDIFGGFRQASCVELVPGLPVRAFLCQSRTDAAWTDQRLLNAFSALQREAGPLYVGGGFRRLSSGLHAGQSAHYAGLALDVGQGLPQRELSALRRLILRKELFDYVEPACMTPTWVHAEVCVRPALDRQYPALSPGERGVHVFVLQDALLQNGMRCALSGFFGPTTAEAVAAFRVRCGLPPGQTADAAMWRALLPHRGVKKGPWPE